MSRVFDVAYRPFQSGKLATPADLEALEVSANWHLPADYRSFLLECNGGSLRPFAFKLEIPDSPFAESTHAMDYFYEVKEIHEYSQLKTQSNLRNLPPGRLAIGTTVSELTITLNMTQQANGKVEAWVRDIFNVWGEGANNTVVPLADTFLSFLEMLHDEPATYSSFWANFGKGAETIRRFSLP